MGILVPLVLGLIKSVECIEVNIATTMYWARCEKHNQSLLRGIPITSTPKSSALFFTRVFTLSLYGVSFSFWLTMWNFRNSHFTKNRKSAFCRFEPESRHQEVYIFTGWADYFFSQNSWDWFSVFSPPYHIMRWFWCCYFESSLPVSMDIFFWYIAQDGFFLMFGIDRGSIPGAGPLALKR